MSTASRAHRRGDRGRSVPSCAPTSTPACRATSSTRARTRPNLPSAACPFCPGGLEAPERLRRALVPQPLAGDAGRALRGDPLHAAARRDASGRSARRARAASSTSGPSAARRSARGPTSTTCSSSRTAAPRSARRSPIRTARSTRSTSFPRRRCASSSAASPFGEPGDRLVAAVAGLARLGARGPGLPVRAAARAG